MHGTGLSHNDLVTLRNDAVLRARSDGPFLDPAVLRRAQAVHATAAWRTAVLGRPWTGIGGCTNAELHLLVLADIAEPAKPEPDQPEAQEARAGVAEQARPAAVEAWDQLAQRLPVAVVVRHNWSIGHYERQVTGADHIVVEADLAVGRLRRSAGQTLCETPARAHDLRAVDRTGTYGGNDIRTPSCKACLRTAQRLAAPHR